LYATEGLPDDYSQTLVQCKGIPFFLNTNYTDCNCANEVIVF